MLFVFGVAGTGLACSGCIAHGDAVATYHIRGTLTDAASGAPLADARVWTMPWAQMRENRELVHEVQATDDGSFAVEYTLGIGSVTWIIVPVCWTGDWRLPPLDVVYVEAEKDGRVYDAELHPPASDQKPLPGGHRQVELGVVPMSLRANGQ